MCISSIICSRGKFFSPRTRLLNSISLFQMVTRTKKIFVGGLSAPTTLEDVKNYFEQFGPVSTNVNPWSIFLTSSTSVCSREQEYKFSRAPAAKLIWNKNDDRRSCKPACAYLCLLFSLFIYILWNKVSSSASCKCYKSYVVHAAKHEKPAGRAPLWWAIYIV